MLNQIPFKGSKLSYRVTGNGNPLLLLHGFGLDKNIWQPLIPYLEPHFNLIIPDLPGSGQSGPLSEPGSIDVMADAIKEVLEREQVKTCAVIGHSMGGYVALSLWKRYNVLQSMILFHSHPFADDAAKKDKRDKDIAFIKKNGSAPFVKQLIASLFSDHFKTSFPHVVRQLIGSYSHALEEGLIYQLQAMRDRPDSSAEWGAGNGRKAIVAGLLDPVIPQEMVTSMAHLSTQTNVLYLKESAHMSMYEQTADVADFLLKWIAV